MYLTVVFYVSEIWSWLFQMKTSLPVLCKASFWTNADSSLIIPSGTRFIQFVQSSKQLIQENPFDISELKVLSTVFMYWYVVRENWFYIRYCFPTTLKRLRFDLFQFCHKKKLKMIFMVWAPFINMDWFLFQRGQVIEITFPFPIYNCAAVEVCRGIN